MHWTGSVAEKRMTMLTPALVLEALGILGVVIYMGSYVLLNAGYITGQGYHYTLMNMAAAICVLASLSQSFNLASAMIQVCWIAISLYGLARLRRERHASRLFPTRNNLGGRIRPAKRRPRLVVNLVLASSGSCPARRDASVREERGRCLTAHSHVRALTFHPHAHHCCMPCARVVHNVLHLEGFAINHLGLKRNPAPPLRR